MKKCDCETRKLSRRIQTARAAQDVPALVACMTEVWGRMEAAETDLAVLRAIQDGTWPPCEGVSYADLKAENELLKHNLCEIRDCKRTRLCDECKGQIEQALAGQGAEKDTESAQ